MASNATGESVAPQSVHQGPPLPPRNHDDIASVGQNMLEAPTTASEISYFQPPPKRMTHEHEDDISSPIHFIRDPHKLVAYLVPFPRPHLKNVPADRVPQRFLIYTPPPPPLLKPAEGDKEAKLHKLQRKWEEEVRAAKTTQAKTLSWKGVKGKVTKGIDWGMGQTKSSSIQFLNRIGGGQEGQPDVHADDGKDNAEHTTKTVRLDEMILIYPASMPGDQELIKKEFIDTMLRSKTKAQRDAVIATGLLPVSAAIDILATLVWPFGGLLEIDAVWAYASIRGAKTSRNVTKRLTSTSDSDDHDKDTLRLSFTPSSRLQALERYLAAKCHEKDSHTFPSFSVAPSETEVLSAIGWSPSRHGDQQTTNWEDEQWEITEVKEDLKSVMGKGAKEWDKWVHAFEKNPEKANKK